MGSVLRKLLTGAAASTVLALAQAHATVLSLTTLENEALSADTPVAKVFQQSWAKDINRARQAGGSYSVTYAEFSVGGTDYLVSSFRSIGECRANACNWQVQRLPKNGQTRSAAMPFRSCGSIEGVDLTGTTLTICGKKVALP